MSKKIDSALQELTKALVKHAEIVGGTAVSIKKAQRAAAKVQTAALNYAKVVHAKTGIGSPFDNLPRNGLEATTMASLNAERAALGTKKPHDKKD